MNRLFGGSMLLSSEDRQGGAGAVHTWHGRDHRPRRRRIRLMRCGAVDDICLQLSNSRLTY